MNIRLTIIAVAMCAFAGQAAAECLPEYARSAVDGAWGASSPELVARYQGADSRRKGQMLYQKSVVLFQTAEKLCLAPDGARDGLVRVTQERTGLSYWTQRSSLAAR